MSELPVEYHKEVVLESSHIPSRQGKPKGHNVRLYATRVEGGYLYRRAERFEEHTEGVGFHIVDNSDTWFAPDINKE